MRIQRNYYEVLGLPRTASQQEIKTKYHELARRYHPDRAQDKVLGERLFVQINMAYRTLMDSEKRAVYDAGLFQADAAARAAAPQSGGAPGASGATKAASQPAAPQQAPVPPPEEQIRDAMEKAAASYMGGDRINAHKICMAVLKYDSGNVDAHTLVGDIYVDQGRRQEALDEYRAAASSGNPSHTLQAKINRVESLILQSRSAMAPRQQAAPPQQKKGIFDRLIGRG